MDQDKKPASMPSPDSDLLPSAETKLQAFVGGKYFKIFMIGILIFAGALSLSYFLTKGFRTQTLEETPPPSTQPIAVTMVPSTANARHFELFADLPQSVNLVALQFAFNAEVDGQALTNEHVQLENFPTLTPTLVNSSTNQILIALTRSFQDSFYAGTKPLKIGTLVVPEDMTGTLTVTFDPVMNKVMDGTSQNSLPIDLPEVTTFQIQ